MTKMENSAPPMADLPAQTGGEVSAPAAPAFGLASMWSSLVDLARDPDVDPEKMTALANLQTVMIEREAERRYLEAKHAAMAEMPTITRNKKIVHPGRDGKPDKEIGRYRDYDSLRIAIDPILRRHRIQVSHRPGVSEGLKMPTCQTILSWTDGELSYVEESEPMPIPFDGTGSKSGPQGAASALKYGQRHSMCAILGIVFEGFDDDATTYQVVPQLTESEKDLETAAQKAAAKGGDAYQAWFMSKSQMTRGWLVDSGIHAEMKAAAAAHDAAS